MVASGCEWRESYRSIYCKMGNLRQYSASSTWGTISSIFAHLTDFHRFQLQSSQKFSLELYNLHCNTLVYRTGRWPQNSTWTWILIRIPFLTYRRQFVWKRENRMMLFLYWLISRRKEGATAISFKRTSDRIGCSNAVRMRLTLMAYKVAPSSTLKSARSADTSFRIHSAVGCRLDQSIAWAVG